MTTPKPFPIARFVPAEKPPVTSSQPKSPKEYANPVLSPEDATRIKKALGLAMTERIITIPARVLERLYPMRVVLVDGVLTESIYIDDDDSKRHDIILTANSRHQAAIMRYILELDAVANGDVIAAVSDGWL